jgi:hypothetical protein
MYRNLIPINLVATRLGEQGGPRRAARKHGALGSRSFWKLLRWRERAGKGGGGRGTVADLFGGDGDLAGLLVSLLPDEPHHLLDLLGDIGVVHLGGGSGPPAKPISQATTTRGKALVQEREGGNRESTGMVEVDVEDVVEQV